MSEPIFEHLTAEAIAEGEQLAHRARTFLAGHLHHPQEGTTAMPVSDDVKKDLTDGIDYVEGWVTRAKAAVPALIADAEKAAGSPITKALEAAGSLIDAPAEEVIAGWISDLAALRGTPPAAEPAQVAS